jgi:hypothetical protein
MKLRIVSMAGVWKFSTNTFLQSLNEPLKILRIKFKWNFNDEDGDKMCQDKDQYMESLVCVHFEHFSEDSHRNGSRGYTLN